MKKRVLVVFILVFFYTWQYAQDLKNIDKIDPVFRTLLSQQKLQNKKHRSQGSKIKDNKGQASKNQTNRKFECIIYTRNAKVLKDKGIVINSTLPAFVTAIVSLEQIEQLASMNDVTYIEAAKDNYPSH